MEKSFKVIVSRRFFILGIRLDKWFSCFKVVVSFRTIHPEIKILLNGTHERQHINPYRLSIVPTDP